MLTLRFEIVKTPMKNHVNYLRSVEKFGNVFIYLTISKENMVRIELLVCLNEQNHLQYDIREVTPQGHPGQPPPPVSCIVRVSQGSPVITVIMPPLDQNQVANSG